MQLLTNFGENPYETPVKNAFPAKWRLQFYKKDTNQRTLFRDTVFKATIFSQFFTLFMFSFYHKNTNF